MTRHVVIESPYYHATASGLVRNQRYLAAAITDSLERGEAPFAGHGFYTRYLNDRDESARRTGIRLHLSWIHRADLVAVYTDLGISKGMSQGITRATILGITIEERKLGGEWDASFQDNRAAKKKRSAK